MWQFYSKRTWTLTPHHSSQKAVWSNPSKDSKPLWRAEFICWSWLHMKNRTFMDGQIYKRISWRCFMESSISDWCDAIVKSKSVRLLGNEKVLALNVYDWLINLIRGLNRMDDATRTFILWPVFIIFYYKSSYNVQFQK